MKNNILTRRSCLTLAGSALLAGSAVSRGAIFSPAHAGARPPIGQLKRLQGQAWRMNDQAREGLSLESPVNFNDLLGTGTDSRARILMRDGTSFNLGANTEFRIDRFVFDPDRDSGEATFTLTRGAFRMVTGLITTNQGGKLPPVHVNTPVGIIGIRGTDFWGLQTEDSLRLALLGGGPITLTTDGGTIEMTRPGSVSVVDRAGAAPLPPRMLTDRELQSAAATVAFPGE